MTKKEPMHYFTVPLRRRFTSYFLTIYSQPPLLLLVSRRAYGGQFSERRAIECSPTFAASPRRRHVEIAIGL